MFGSPTGSQTRSPDLRVQQLLDEFDAGLGLELRDQPGVEAAIRRTLGVAYLRMGRYAKRLRRLPNCWSRIFGSLLLRVPRKNSISPPIRSR